MPGENAPWKEIVADSYDLATTTGVIKLARYGIAANSLNAGKLVEYLNDLRMLNFDKIPLRYSIKRLGYIEGMGFAPYTDKLVFGATSDLRNMYDSISENGSTSTTDTLLANFGNGFVSSFVCFRFFSSFLGKLNHNKLPLATIFCIKLHNCVCSSGRTRKEIENDTDIRSNSFVRVRLETWTSGTSSLTMWNVA